ncbi:hypothetical protein NMY22_g12223 [Coprinellus aureogranulatus]|nr:hypothetical protein NMY22_g12223 [Coprinellus aureogranulatus]
METTTRTKDLPAELKAIVVSFSSVDTLPNIALANKELRHFAEKSLYSYVIVRTYDQRIRALKTLVTSPEKAMYVKYLSVEFYRLARDTDDSVIEWLLQVAPAMKNLTDLRLRLRPDLASYFNRLQGALCAEHFHLKTLFLSANLDLKKVTQAQQSLKFLAIHESVWCGPRDLLPSLRDRQLVVVWHERDTFLPVYNNVALAPDLLSLGQARTFHILFRQYVACYEMTSIRTDPNSVLGVTVYIQTSPARGILPCFFQSIAKASPRVCDIELHVKGSSIEDLEVDPIEGLPELRLVEWT